MIASNPRHASWKMQPLLDEPDLRVFRDLLYESMYVEWVGEVISWVFRLEYRLVAEA